MSQNLVLFRQLGPENFSAAIGNVAPYFASIEPKFVDLRKGFAEVRIRNQRKVHNHIGTVHAIALCNGAELVAGTCTDVSIPEGARWLPIGMTVQYLAKAKTDIRVVTEAETVDWSQPGNIEVPVAAYDTEGTKVMGAVITMNVKH
ncbi:MAG TPA: hotdog fold domain-containing protein [Rhizobacter sp.]|nr:hotdog fold domain-containing protein [Rhizobacter sp.]